MTTIPARPLTLGIVTADLLLLAQPLSLWGGLELETGLISDVTHPQHGTSLTGKVLAMTAARGSSSSSSALVEAVRRRTGPAAIILGRVDPILVIGSLVAADLYDIEVPIVIVDAGNWHQLAEARHAIIDGRENLLRLS